MKIVRPLLVAFALAAPVAEAKLPPPTPEEIAAQEARRAQEEAQLQREKALLERAQDRVAERYGRDRAARPAGRVNEADLPHNTRELPGNAPPQGGREQSAEAHSAPAK